LLGTGPSTWLGTIYEKVLRVNCPSTWLGTIYEKVLRVNWRHEMTKKDIAIKIADETGIKQIVVKEVVQKTIDAMIEALSTGQTLELRNFGIFKVKERKARTGRNPRTGEKVDVPPKKVVVFKPGLVMKQRVK
jgi:nucleoid DNA-binding protein